eukprot:g30899.t1
MRVYLVDTVLNTKDKYTADRLWAALKASIMKNIPDLASQGYLILFHLWAMLGKIVMVSIFILREPPRSPLPLISLSQCDKLFAAYDKRAEVQRHFEDVLKNQRKWALKMKIFTFWDAKLIPLITKVVTGSYIGLSAWLVSTGNSTLGTIVATINVYEAPC